MLEFKILYNAGGRDILSLFSQIKYPALSDTIITDILITIQTEYLLRVG